MKKLLMLAALAVIAAGCSVTKINYKKDADGVCEYRIYHNDHWLKRDTGAMSGGMSQDGKFEVKLESATVSPSEEFNRTMQTYTTAFVQLAQIAAAAYNPSSSTAATQSDSGKAGSSQIILEVPKTESQPVQQVPLVLAEARSSTGNNATASQTSQSNCADGSCSDGACTDGSCTPEVK